MDAPLKTEFRATLEAFNALMVLVDKPSYKHKEVVSQDKWTKELGRFHRGADEVGAWESGQDAVDSRISRYNCQTPTGKSAPEHLIKCLQNLRQELSEAQEEVVNTPSDSDSKALLRKNPEEKLEFTFCMIETTIHALDTWSECLSKSLALQEQKY